MKIYWFILLTVVVHNIRLQSLNVMLMLRTCYKMHDYGTIALLNSDNDIDYVLF